MFLVRLTRIWSRRRWVGIALVVTSLAACDNARIQVCFSGDANDVQVSPSGRAVALVDPETYSAVLSAPADAPPDMNCAVDEYLSRFQTRPEAIIFTVDFEDEAVTLSRLTEERGFHFFGDLSREMSDDELREYSAVVQEVRGIVATMPREPVFAFNARYHDLEEGTGSGSLAQCSPGCPSFLRGYLFLPNKESLVAGRFMHEFAHFWGAHLQGPDPLADQIQIHDGHWGFTSVGGQLGGWVPGSLVNNADGTWSGRVFPAGRASNVTPYAPLELYLMGMIPAGLVEPIETAVGVRDVSKGDDNVVTFGAERIETISIENIVAANGPRSPTSDASTNRFRVALVILADHQLNTEEWDFYERAIDFLEADQDEDILEAFPEAQYPGHHDAWKFFSNDGREPYLNFFSTTSGNGTLQFEKVTNTE